MTGFQNPAPAFENPSPDSPKAKQKNPMTGFQNPAAADRKSLSGFSKGQTNKQAGRGKVIQSKAVQWSLALLPLTCEQRRAAAGRALAAAVGDGVQVLQA